MASNESIAETWRIAAKGLLSAGSGAIGMGAYGWREFVCALSKASWMETVRFLDPAEFEVEGEFAIIAYMSQDSVVSGIREADLELIDPPVFVSENADPLTWRPEFEKASEWSQVASLWALVKEGRGVLAYNSKGAKRALKRVSSSTSELVPFSSRVGLLFRRIRESVVLCFANKAVFVWAENLDNWREIEAALGIDWDYCSEDNA